MNSSTSAASRRAPALCAPRRRHRRAAISPARADTLPERFASLYEAAKKEGQVVFYTSYRQETSTAVLEFWRKTFPDVKLNIVQKQTLDLIPTIEAEKAAGRTNRGRGLHQPALHPRRLEEARLPRPLQGARLRPDRRQLQGRRTATTSPPRRRCSRPPITRRVFPDPSVLPKKIADFLDPKWKGKIVFSDPRTAASQLTWFQTPAGAQDHHLGHHQGLRRARTSC